MAGVIIKDLNILGGEPVFRGVNRSGAFAVRAFFIAGMGRRVKATV